MRFKAQNLKRLFALLAFAGFSVVAVHMVTPVGFANAQDGKTDLKAKVPAAQAGRGSELNEALRRIDRLEAQITEMQSVIGALQTMVQKGVNQAPAPRGDTPFSPPADDRSRGDNNFRDNSFGDRGDNTPQDRSGEGLGRFDNDRQLARRDVDEPAFATDGWGADIRSELERQNNVPPADVQGDTPVSRARVNGEAPRQIYDTGYNYLMASDYASAEATFKNFLSSYPEDNLAGNAQYWLGESYFARGDYRKAAGEFLKGYKSYKDSQKAPDNLLKLGMSLQRLGQSEAACQTFNELKTRYKSLPGHISRNVDGEMDRANCG